MHWITTTITTIAVVLVGTSLRANVVAQWDTGSGGNAHVYELVGQRGDATIHWATAKTDAEAMQYLGVFGHLATITSAEENAFIQSAFNDGLRHSAWIGLTDDEAYGGQESGGPSNPGAPYWVWVTGEPVAYTNWIAGAPNNQLHIPEGEDYTEFVFENQGEWNDLPDFQPHLRDFYLVEYDVPPSNVVARWDTGSGGNGHVYELVGQRGDRTIQWATAKARAYASKPCRKSVGRGMLRFSGRRDWSLGGDGLLAISFWNRSWTTQLMVLWRACASAFMICPTLG